MKGGRNNTLAARSFLILVLTSRTEVEHREWSAAMPNVEFLEKPISPRKLLGRLKAYYADAPVPPE